MYFHMPVYRGLGINKYLQLHFQNDFIKDNYFLIFLGDTCCGLKMINKKSILTE